MDTLTSLEAVPEAMRVLESIAGKFETYLAKEACETARLLVNIAQQKKERELSPLRLIKHEQPAAPNEATSLPFESTEINWEEFFATDMMDLLGTQVEF